MSPTQLQPHPSVHLPTLATVFIGAGISALKVYVATTPDINDAQREAVQAAIDANQAVLTAFSR